MYMYIAEFKMIDGRGILGLGVGNPNGACPHLCMPLWRNLKKNCGKFSCKIIFVGGDPLPYTCFVHQRCVLHFVFNFRSYDNFPIYGTCICTDPHYCMYITTVDQEIFAVKNFRRSRGCRKLNAWKIISRYTYNTKFLARWRKLNVLKFKTWNLAKISRSTVYLRRVRLSTCTSCTGTCIANEVHRVWFTLQCPCTLCTCSLGVDAGVGVEGGGM